MRLNSNENKSSKKDSIVEITIFNKMRLGAEVWVGLAPVVMGSEDEVGRDVGHLDGGGVLDLAEGLEDLAADAGNGVGGV